MLADSVKRWLVMGLGLAVLTKEKAEEIVQDLIRQGQLSRSEGRELLEDLLRRAEVEKDDLRQKWSQQMHRVLDTTGIASKDDIREIRARLEEIDARLRRLEPDV